jgi:serine/threonine-protein kinase
MSPEQAQGSPNLDQRADVWSLAVIAYECLSGKLPFCGPNGPSTLLQILTQPPPPLSSWLAEADPAWTTAVDAALAGGLTKNPAERSPSAGAFVERLAAALGAGQRPAGAPRSGPQVAPPALGNGSGTLVGLPELPSGLRAPRRAFVDRPAHVLWLAVGASFVLLVVLGLFMA